MQLHRRSDLERQLVCVVAASGKTRREQRRALAVDRINAAAINCIRARPCSSEIAVIRSSATSWATRSTAATYTAAASSPCRERTSRSVTRRNAVNFAVV